MQVYELNMDGLVGPSHHYAGLAPGNIASKTNANRIANPAAAAHQGIKKMRLLHQMGLKQALLPPHQRPNLDLLHQLGFTGTPTEQITKAKRADPMLLSACFSASSMWAANSATVTASIDTDDKRVHFTAANLVSNLHRHQEANFYHQLFRTIFSDERYFHHHSPLPHAITTSDEGAANHSRLCASHNDRGTYLFVYGKRALVQNNSAYPEPKHFPARQTLEASQAIARSHLINPNHLVFACQNPAAIDQGVFHNDVIAVANESLLLVHEEAFLDQAHILNEICSKSKFPVNIIEVQQQRITITEAISSYLFNSQIVTLPHYLENKKMALIAPVECEENQAINILIEELISDNSNPISEVHYLDLKQSMQNGGGPACLRLRVPLNTREFSAMHQGVLVDDKLLNHLDTWIDKHYRSRLHADDLADPDLINECYSALDALTTILNLGSIYPFQRESICGKR